MSSTLARRIRRIGILPSTFVDTTEDRLVKNDAGKEVKKTLTIRKTVRNRASLSLAQLTAIRADIIADARAKRKQNKSRLPKAA